MCKEVIFFNKIKKKNILLKVATKLGNSEFQLELKNGLFQENDAFL